ncbi:MAG: hypothetical protein AB7P40_18165 [Chloroflexota bacterium]
MIARILLVLAVLILPPIALRAFGRPLRGSLLGMPYDFRPPTPSRVKHALWNPDSDRVLSPHVYGWGYSVNLHALGRRLGLLAA